MRSDFLKSCLFAFVFISSLLVAHFFSKRSSALEGYEIVTDFVLVSGGGEQATLSWQQPTSILTMGFNLYRSDTLDGPKQLVNDQLILNQCFPDILCSGYVYQYTDTDPGRYYWLYNFTIEGVETLNYAGPVENDLPATLSSISASVSSIGGTITWTTDEAASSQLEYGLNTGLGTTTPVTDTDPLVTSHSVSLSSLLSCTIYYYRTVSVDSGSNVSYSDTDLFVTSGCAGTTANASVSAYGLSSLTNSTGTGLTLASTVSGLALTLPPSVSSSLDAGTTFDLQAKVLDSASVMSVISSPTLPASAPSNTGNQLISNIFDLKLYTGVTTTLSSFDQPVTLTLSYTPSQIDNVNPSTLSIYRHDGTTWHALTSTHDSTTRTLSATTTAFSLFAIFGQTYQPSSSSSSPPSSSNPGPPLCTDQLPSSIPDLFEIQTTSTTARLKFTPISNTSTYYISFSTSPQAEQHGELVTLLREGEQTHTVYQLRPNTTYYFKVRGQNGCMPGPWSDTIKAKTNFSTTRLSFFYKWLSRFGKLILNPATTNF